MAATALFKLLASVVAVTQLFAVRVGPGRELTAVASDVKIFQVNQLQVDGAGDKAGIEDGLQTCSQMGRAEKSP